MPVVKTLATSCCLGSMALLALLSDAPAASGQEKGRWVNVSDSVVAKLAKEGKKPGIYGPTSGVAVDSTNGDVYLIINDQGLWKSVDQGASFERIDQGAISGRCETGFAMDVDPAGKRLACFPVYGSAALGANGGKTWQKSSTGHIDCIAVAWPDTSMVAIRHESGGTLILSPDGGKTWKTLGKGFDGAGIFDAQTIVGVKSAGIVRSTDGGQTWVDVPGPKPTGKAMRLYKGAGYWVSDNGLLVSRDKGATWTLLGSPVKCTLGPYFGKDAKHIVVAGKQGLMETADGGQTWKLAAPLPPGIDGGLMSQVGWDPINDVFYCGRMGQPTFKYQR